MSGKQGPPQHGRIDLATTYIGKQPKPGKDLNGGGFNASSTTRLPNNHSGQFGIQPGHVQIFRNLKSTTTTLAEEYQIRSNQLPQTIENELAATRTEGPTNPVPPIEGIIRELGVLNRLWARKRAEFDNKTAIANSFYGYDPIGRPLAEFPRKAKTIESPVRPNGVAMQAWNTSYRAAHDARLLLQTIHSLNQRSINLQQTLAALQAAEQARIAAEQQAQRIAAEQARIRAEAEALAQAQEQARLAALAEAKRVAEEKARKAQEAKEQEEAAEKRRAEADAQLKELSAFFAAMDAARADRPFPVSGSAVAGGPVFTLASGRLATHPATTQAVRAALQSAVATVMAAGIASAGAVMVGFAALLFPSPLGNSDRREMSIPPLSDLVPDDLHNWSLSLSEYEPDDLHALSVPLSDLVADAPQDLYAIAEANGDIELPVAMGSRTVGNTTEFFVTATNGTTVPSKVPVRLATLDPTLNVYRSYTPDAPSIGMTWTPIVKPNNASTSLPASELNVAVYDGTTVTALEGRIDTFPELDLYSFGGFITVFPAESGMPPVYTMFRDRRNEPGMASGYGEAVSGVWLGVASQGEGAAIPKQIADKLRGRDFSSFRAFRETLWRAAIDDPDLAKQFTANNIEEMKNGRAPFTRKNDRLGGQVKFELHHVNRVSKGGDVYGIDNIRIVTPKRHSELHKGGN
ncbi:hypothetical protein ABH909_001540 [Pseudomonas sp. BS3782 TE3695]|uniref:S-type pyocin domain-containing protein n=1 Tax=Pseudomonas sp. BS3782 TE3695 TaxID=3349323 RepID=UPI003D1D9504